MRAEKEEEAPIGSVGEVKEENKRVVKMNGIEYVYYPIPHILFITKFEDFFNEINLID